MGDHKTDTEAFAMADLVGVPPKHKLNGTYNVSDYSMGVSVSRKTDGVALAMPVGITTHVDRTYKTVA